MARGTRFKGGGSGGGGGGDSPDIIWAEALKQRDALGQVKPVLVDTPRYRDMLSKVQPVLLDTPRYRDARVSTASSVTAAKSDNLKLPDALARAFFQNMEVARSGTPDNDKSGDFWADRALPTTAHGNENLVCQAATVPGVSNDEREGYMKWDLRTTTLENLTVRTGGAHTFTFYAVNNDPLLAKNLSVTTFHNGTTNPFTESTANYNTRPTAGTQVKAAQTISVPPTTAALMTITYTDAEAALMLGKWVYWRFLSGDLVATIFFTITSRDSATNRPQLTLDLKRA